MNGNCFNTNYFWCVFIDINIFFSEFYYHSGITAEQYQKELEYQLRKTTLGISVGLVKEVNGYTRSHDGDKHVIRKTSRYFNPYSHFARDHEHEDEYNHLDGGNESIKENIHEYKICEVRPPSIEKVR